MRVLHLYRPRLPDTRAQSIQVLRTCHALAEQGHEVTLFADRGDTPKELWQQMGLQPHGRLSLHLAPARHPGLAGVWFRRSVREWWNGPPGIVLARDKKRLIQAIKANGKKEHRIVLETHELDSLKPSGQTDTATFSMEQKCLAVSDALIANCSGTLSAWQAHHQFSIPAFVCHNATHVQPRAQSTDAEGVMVMGSMRKNKGVEAILTAVQALDTRFRWVGGTQTERNQWGNQIHLEAPVPHAEVETVLTQAKVLLLPLGNNPFSHQFTSPLKLWDYLATEQPIVAANTKAVIEICRDFAAEVFPYEPEDPVSIQQAVRRALEAPKRKPIQRTWATRAQELSTVFMAVQ